jgi:malonate transporter and related proteins
MPPILAVTIPFFALVAMGYAAAHKRLLPESAIPGLNAFVLWFALPAMLFRFGMTTPIGQLLNPTVLAVSLVASLAIVGFTLAVTLSPRVPMKDAAFGALVAAFPNTGFMGVPLLTALLGAAAAGPVICAVLIDLFVTTSLCIALAQAHDAVGAGGNARTAGKRALAGALSNPLPWSIALGAGCSVAGISLGGPSSPLATIVDMLADAASPVALFTIGAVLWRAGQHAHTRTPLALVMPVVAIKLFVHPFAVFALAATARALGAPLGIFETTVLVLAAALPSASNVSLLAERYGADNGRVARIILGSTVLSFVTFSLLATALRVPAGN